MQDMDIFKDEDDFDGLFYSDFKNSTKADQKSSNSTGFKGYNVDDRDFVDSDEDYRNYNYRGRKSTKSYNNVIDFDDIDIRPARDKKTFVHGDVFYTDERLRNENKNKLFNKHRNEPISFKDRRYYNNYNGNKSSVFSKQDNISFAFKVIGVVLLALLIRFVCMGQSAFAGVTAVIVIMYVMNIITKNTKGNNKK